MSCILDIGRINKWISESSSSLNYSKRIVMNYWRNLALQLKLFVIGYIEFQLLFQVVLTVFNVIANIDIIQTILTSDRKNIKATDFNYHFNKKFVIHFCWTFIMEFFRSDLFVPYKYDKYLLASNSVEILFFRYMIWMLYTDICFFLQVSSLSSTINLIIYYHE